MKCQAKDCPNNATMEFAKLQVCSECYNKMYAPLKDKKFR
jgi:hypothetical protein